ncbi:MAG: divalent-cation tolerance protein CutA [Gammaproteobacteria bacterium]|nr:divalent-cation tolerance protein CutA [Gammaproteobacteria bacterium]
MSGIELILCACPDVTSAQTIADTLVERRLAACVTILPGATSVYRWQGKREQSQELILLIKSTAAAYDKLEQAVLEIHPYELPELVVVPIEHGLGGYLGWVREETSPS